MKIIFRSKINEGDSLRFGANISLERIRARGIDCSELFLCVEFGHKRFWIGLLKNNSKENEKSGNRWFRMGW